MTRSEATTTRTSFTSFAESSAEDWALLRTQMVVTQERVADHVLMLLRAMDSDHGGYPVTRLEHSLQTATRAERAGHDDEYVLCALVHDIGDTLAPYDHPAIAATMLRGLVSEANLFMVEQHGIFQGWYFWHHIGGDRNARDRLKGHEYYDHTEEFVRKYDMEAFDPDYSTPPLEHYEPLLRSFFTRT